MEKKSKIRENDRLIRGLGDRMELEISLAIFWFLVASTFHREGRSFSHVCKCTRLTPGARTSWHTSNEMVISGSFPLPIKCLVTRGHDPLKYPAPKVTFEVQYSKKAINLLLPVDILWAAGAKWRGRMFSGGLQKMVCKPLLKTCCFIFNFSVPRMKSKNRDKSWRWRVALETFFLEGEGCCIELAINAPSAWFVM